MWFIFITHFVIFITKTSVLAHIPEALTTATTKVEKYCELAETCVHDTISVCGKSDQELRTFLDICDLFEFGCDSGQLFQHVNDQNDCPKEATPESEIL